MGEVELYSAEYLSHFLTSSVVMFGMQYLLKILPRRYGYSRSLTAIHKLKSSTLALSRLATLELRRSCRRRGLARVLRAHMGLIKQHGAHFRTLRLEVRFYHTLLHVLLSSVS